MNLSLSGRIACSFATVFIAAVTCRADEPPATAERAGALPPAVHVRGDLHRSREVFATTGQGRVVFLGGSITEMDGYRPMVMDSLVARFPGTEFNFINAGMSSTCSHTGAFRLPSDVLSHKPDLLFVEFAVNDDQDAAHSYEDALRGMEGVIRSARSSLPQVDIVITYFVNPPMLEKVQDGEVPTSIAAHDAVAKHYNVSTCNVAVELAKQIGEGKTTWAIYGGVHPKPAGNRIAADLIEDVFRQARFSPAEAKSASRQTFAPHPLPPPIDPTSFWRGRFLPRDAISMGSGWSFVEPQWKDIDGSFRERFAGRPLTVATVAEAELQVAFSGTAIGLFVLAGPDAGVVEFSIDDGDWHAADLYHRFSKGLHYPRTVVLKSGLEDGPHQMKLRVSKKKNGGSQGNAVRILEFVAS